MPARRKTADASVAAEYVEVVCRVVAARGIGQTELLAGTGITPAALSDPRGRIPHARFALLVRRARDLTGDPGLGLASGLATNIKTHGFLGYAALSSETLGDAIDLAIRYFRTRTTMQDLDFFVEGDTAVLQFNERVPLGDLLPFAIDSLLATFFVIRTQLVSDEAPRGEVRVTYDRQPHHALLLAGGGNLRFNCAFNQLRFPASELSRRLNFADPQLVRMAAAQCEEELKKLHDGSGLLGDVRRLVAARLADDASIEVVAPLLHMAPRTLRRRLAELGTNYQMLVAELRRGLAMEWLATGTRSVEEVAAALGYSDPSNFGRAFRRWTGITPSAYRRD